MTKQRATASNLRNPGCWLLVAMILFLLLIIALLLFFLLRPEGAAVALCEPGFERTALREPLLTPGGPAARGTQQVAGEVLITGDPADVRTVVEAVVETDSTYNGTACAGTTEGAAGSASTLGALTLASDLYQLPAGADEGEFIRVFYERLLELNDGRPDPLVAFADPNYVIGYYIEGDPSNGHSGIIGGLAAAQPTPLVTPNADELFRTQWIFGALPGIGLLDGNGGRVVDASGVGVTVVIFDTVPDAELPGFISQVIAPESLPLFGYPAGDENCCELDVADHGVFAAGLVNQVAPEATIVLVRVLNDRGQGDLFTLVQALDDYLLAQNESLARTVYNLSLGLGQQLEPPFEGYRDVLARLRDQVDDAAVTAMAEPVFPIPAFHSRLLKADEAGALVAAATGNDSLGVPALETQIPAAYPPVVAVSGHDFSGEHSCFANAGALTAPAGSGIVSAPFDPTQQRPLPDIGPLAERFNARYEVIDGACQPALITKWCTAVADALTGDDPALFAACPLAVISTVSSATYEEGYAYWIGTSFSTPLVSGVAALLMEAGNPAPAAVAGALYCSTPGGAAPASMAPDQPLGAGPISAARALSERCLP